MDFSLEQALGFVIYTVVVVLALVAFGRLLEGMAKSSNAFLRTSEYINKDYVDVNGSNGIGSAVANKKRPKLTINIGEVANNFVNLKMSKTDVDDPEDVWKQRILNSSTALDQNTNTDITDKIEIVGTVKTSTPGSYKIRVGVTDSVGLSTSYIMNIIVE